MGYTILVAEDDNDIVAILRMYLESSGYHVLTADNGVAALELLCTEQVDLAILDVMMPQMDGFTLTQRIRKSRNIPILLLTAKIADSDKITGLNLGADDYLTKPFNPVEILARVNANLRRFYQLGAAEKPQEDCTKGVLTVGELRLDTNTLVLRKENVEISLTPNEYKLLRFLMQSPGRVYTKSQLCEALNGEYYENYESTIMVHISHLREKLEEDPRNPRYIINVRSIGYKIKKAD